MNKCFIFIFVLVDGGINIFMVLFIILIIFVIVLLIGVDEVGLVVGLINVIGVIMDKRNWNIK